MIGMLGHGLAASRAILRKFFRFDQGITLIETAIVLPLILALIFAFIDYSLLLFNEIVLANNVRSAAHFAASSPQAWSNTSPTTDRTTIEGWIQPAIGTIPNDDSHIVITYITTSTGVSCGSYSAATGAFSPTASLSSCVSKGNLIKITTNYTYTFVSPLPTLAGYLGQSVGFNPWVVVHPSATILEEK